MSESLQHLVDRLNQAIGWHTKEAIGPASVRFPGFDPADPRLANGDDGALIPNPDGDGFLVLAAEGMTSAFTTQDPWFAGWSSVMVNISDIVAMGGRPIAVVDVVWSCGDAVLDGMHAAATAYGVPVVGGHSGDEEGGLPHVAVAILGHCQTPLLSNSAQPGDHLVAVVDLRGDWRGDFPFWNAATTAPPERLRNDLQLLPKLCTQQRLHAGRDISMGGLLQTAALISERSNCSMTINPQRLPGVNSTNLDEWVRRLIAFPSYGYLLSVAADQVNPVIELFNQHQVAAATVGWVEQGPPSIHLTTASAPGEDQATVLLRDLSAQPLLRAQTKT